MNGTASPPKKKLSKADREAEQLHVTVELDAERDRAHARKIMLLGIAAGLLLTVAGNVTATIPSAAGRVLSIIVFSLAPVMAAWALHIIYTLSSVGAVTRANVVRLRNSPWLFRVAVMVGAAVFGVSLGVSYEHLRAVAIMGGMSGWASYAFPATIDAVLLVCTAAWFALRPASDADLRTARSAASPQVVAADRVNDRVVDCPTARVNDRPVTVSAPMNDRVNDRPVTVPHVAATAPVNDPVNDPVTDRVTDEHLTEARALLKRTGKRTPAATVAEVLRQLDDDTPVLAIASTLGMGERTVRQIRDSRHSEAHRELVAV